MWLELSQGEGNSRLLVNMDRVEVAVRSGGGSALYFHSDSQEFYRVNQTLEEIKSMIAEAEGF